MYQHDSMEVARVVLNKLGGNNSQARLFILKVFVLNVALILPRCLRSSRHIPTEGTTTAECLIANCIALWKGEEPAIDRTRDRAKIYKCVLGG